MLDYFTHKFRPEKFHLCMTILVKNEIDIIEANIRTHAKLGVDSFMVMDHQSNDGTREVLEALQHDYEITIIDQKGLYEQKKFMTLLAFEAKKRYQPDWIINNDADEFWIPDNACSLKKYLAFKGGILRVNRSNMLPPMNAIDNPFAYTEAKYQIKNHIHYRNNKQKNVSILLGQTSRKVMVNPHGLIKINTGNHSAEHIALWNKKIAQNIHIYHYPIRSFEQFERRVISRMEAIEKGAKIGTHEKRWDMLYRKGMLMKEFEYMICLSDFEINYLTDIGVLVENHLPQNTIIKPSIAL